MSKGTTRPYLHFVGNNAVDVTGSCTILRFDKIKLALDMGLIQTNNIVADYRANRDMMKRIKPKTVHGVVISHNHADHICGLLSAVHMGMNAYIYVPQGSLPIMRIMLEDCVKIIESDSTKLQNKHGVKAPPLATLEDVDKVMSWCVEVPFNKPFEIVGGAKLTYYDAGHIINSAQGIIEFKQGYTIKRVGLTGDICNEPKSKSVRPLQPLSRVDVLVSECTYSDPTRCYSMKKDRWYDEQMIVTAINQYHRILIPTFAQQRLEDILEVLAKLGVTKRVYVDTPLGEKIYRAWPEPLDYEDRLNLKFVQSWEESQALQISNEPCIIVASSGMLTAGRAVCYLKYLLPSPNNAVLFIGYSSENTTATEIKQGSKSIKVDGEVVPNRAQIYSLNSFSSHSNYNQLMKYLMELDYQKVCLVHSDYESKVAFANTLQNNLIAQGKSSRVIAVNADSKIYF